MMMGGLVPPGDPQEGLPVLISAEVHNVAGDRARAEREVVLSTATLEVPNGGYR
jgi:hypothetical protein